MSDTEDLEIPIDEPELPKTKPKRIMSPEALERLAKAREKAAQVKRQMKAAREEKEDEIRQKVKAERIAKMEQKVNKSFIDLDEKPKESKAKAEPVEKTELSEEVVVKKKPKKKVVIMHDSGSDSDENTQVIYIPKKKSTRKPTEQAAENSAEPAPPTPSRQLNFAATHRTNLHNFNSNRMFYQ